LEIDNLVRSEWVLALGLFKYLSLSEQVVVEELFKKTGIPDNHGKLLSFLTLRIINPALIAALKAPNCSGQTRFAVY